MRDAPKGEGQGRDRWCQAGFTPLGPFRAQVPAAQQPTPLTTTLDTLVRLRRLDLRMLLHPLVAVVATAVASALVRAVEEHRRACHPGSGRARHGPIARTARGRAAGGRAKCRCCRQRSGGTQARYWWAAGSRCGRPLIGTTPVPQSAPQPVSCVPLPHPGRRVFPSPVGSESVSRQDLPGCADSLSSGERTLPTHRSASRFGELHVSCHAGRHFPAALAYTLRSPTLARGSFAPETLRSLTATMSPCADPDASRSHFSVDTL